MVKILKDKNCLRLEEESATVLVAGLIDEDVSQLCIVLF